MRNDYFEVKDITESFYCAKNHLKCVKLFSEKLIIYVYPKILTLKFMVWVYFLFVFLEGEKNQIKKTKMACLTSGK